jgi:hypothetical protein
LGNQNQDLSKNLEKALFALKVGGFYRLTRRISRLILSSPNGA